MGLWNLNKRILIIVLVSLLLAGLVTASVVNYVSNSITAEVTVQTECNDGVDNGDGGGFDINDIDCHDDGTLNPLTYNICRNEDGSITNCV